MPSVTQASADKAEPVSAKVDAKDVKSTDAVKEVTAESTQVLPEGSAEHAPGTLIENTEGVSILPEQTVEEETPAPQHILEVIADVKGSDVEQAETVEQIVAHAEVQKAEIGQCQVLDQEHANAVTKELETTEEASIPDTTDKKHTEAHVDSYMKAVPESIEPDTQVEITEASPGSPPISNEPDSQAIEKHSEEISLTSNVDAVDNQPVRENSIKTDTTDPDQCSIGNVPEEKPEATVQIEAPTLAESGNDQPSHNIIDLDGSVRLEDHADQIESGKNGIIEEVLIEYGEIQVTKSMQCPQEDKLDVCEIEELIVEKPEVTGEEVTNFIADAVSVENKEISEKSEIEEATSQKQLDVPSSPPLNPVIESTEKTVEDEDGKDTCNSNKQLSIELCEEKEDNSLAKENMSTDQIDIENCMSDQANQGGNVEILKIPEQKVTLETVSDIKNVDFLSDGTLDQEINPDKDMEDNKNFEPVKECLKESDLNTEKQVTERVEAEKSYVEEVVLNNSEIEKNVEEATSPKLSNIADKEDMVKPERETEVVADMPVMDETKKQTDVISLLSEEKEDRNKENVYVEKAESVAVIEKCLVSQHDSLTSVNNNNIPEMVEKMSPEEKENRQIPDVVTEKALEQCLPGVTDQKIEISSCPVMCEDIITGAEIEPQMLQPSQQDDTIKSPAVASTISSERDKLDEDELVVKPPVVNDLEASRSTEIESTAECIPHTVDHFVELASPPTKCSQQEIKNSEEGMLTSEPQEKKDDMLQPLIKSNKVDESGEVTVHVAVEVLVF